MISQNGLFRKFCARLNRREQSSRGRREQGLRLQNAFEAVVFISRQEYLPRHLVALRSNRGDFRTEDFNGYAVLSYLGRIGDKEYFFDFVESSTDRPHAWDCRFYVGRASRRRPIRVAHVPVEQIDGRMIRSLMGAVVRVWRQKLPPFHIPRGYYPYCYFYNWYSVRWGRRKHHTIHCRGILKAASLRRASRMLIKQFRDGASVDSMYVLTGHGYRSLDTYLDGKKVWAITPDFLKRGILRVERRRR